MRAALATLPTSIVMFTQDARVDFALAVIAHHFKDGNLNVNTLAAAVHLSPSHLRRILVCATHMTPCQIIKHFRLECSKLLLTDTFLSVKEINYTIGLNDVSHFVRDFKLKYGMTPSEYRAKVGVGARRFVPDVLPTLQTAVGAR